jgi:hypothetical protein
VAESEGGVILRKILRWLVAGALLIYGLMRLVVGLGLLGHQIGLFEISSFQEPIDDVATFLFEHHDRAAVPMSVAGYVGYIATMGLVLSIGAIGSMVGRRYGPALVAAFLALYAALFLNFQTVNAKIVHLVVCAVLFVILVQVRTRSED